MESPNKEGVCGGRSCTFAVQDKDLGCNGGDAHCVTAHLVEADESVFHSADLIKATAEIKQILESIPAHREGRKLSFVNTNMGTLLAWVTHEMKVTEDAVTPEHDDNAIAEALGLKNFGAKGATQAY